MRDSLSCYWINFFKCYFLIKQLKMAATICPHNMRPSMQLPGWATQQTPIEKGLTMSIAYPADANMLPIRNIGTSVPTRAPPLSKLEGQVPLLPICLRRLCFFSLHITIVFCCSRYFSNFFVFFLCLIYTFTYMHLSQATSIDSLCWLSGSLQFTLLLILFIIFVYCSLINFFVVSDSLLKKNDIPRYGHRSAQNAISCFLSYGLTCPEFYAIYPRHDK